MVNYQFGGDCENCELAERCYGFCMKKQSSKLRGKYHEKKKLQ
jgi:radical SAM protein with 4Fe4S-binding SPASM domain